MNAIVVRGGLRLVPRVEFANADGLPTAIASARKLLARAVGSTPLPGRKDDRDAFRLFLLLFFLLLFHRFFSSSTKNEQSRDHEV
jgi:hypothetical protein